MAELLLLNPRRRRRVAKKTRRARRRNPIANLARRRTPARPARRRSNPIAARRRRRNPVSLRAASRTMGRRRRRNPIGMGGLNVRNVMKTLGDAAVMGAGAIAVDLGWSRLNGMLPATVQTVPGRLGAGDAVKAILTAALGILANRATKGLAGKAALGSLTVQARDAAMKMLPPAVAMQAAGLGYYSPAAVIPGSPRIGPNRAINNNGAGRAMGAYLAPGVTPLLNGQRTGAYLRPGSSPLLNGRIPASVREGVRYK